jgi:Tol biopolymer transport system component
VTTVANIDGTDASKIQAPEGLAICAARWSPDGTELVYQLRAGASRDVGNLFVEDLSSGRRTQLTDLALHKAWWWYLHPSFSTDGHSVIFQLPRSSSEATGWDVWSVPVTGGEPTLLLKNASLPRYFPDGKTMAFLSPWSNDFAGTKISTISGASVGDPQAARRTLVEANGSISWPETSPDGSRIAYEDGGSIYVVEVSTGESSEVAIGNTAEWLDEDTLIVAPTP